MGTIPDTANRMKVDYAERAQHVARGTFQEIHEGRSGVPRGHKVLPLKRQCRVKNDGRFKVRWVVLGNVDDFEGETYAPTVCKSIVWLVFAVAVLLNLCWR